METRKHKMKLRTELCGEFLFFVINSAAPLSYDVKPQLYKKLRHLHDRATKTTPLSIHHLTTSNIHGVLRPVLKKARRRLGQVQNEKDEAS